MTMTTAAPAFPRQVVGIVELASSLLHGGDETLGTTKLMRTKGWIYDGRKIKLPVVSGNALRGLWRRACATAFLDAYLEAGGEPVSLSAFYYLTSGGALHKGSTGSSIDLAGERSIRHLIPHVGLFGGAGLGRIQAGKLLVDEMVPVCMETVDRLSRIWPAVRDAPTAGMSIRELVEIHGYSRQDDAKDVWMRRYLRSTDREAVEAQITADEESDDAKPAGKPQQMRYENVELVAGTCLFHRWGFRLQPTREELAGLAAGLMRWAERPHVGGRNSVGHGNLLVDYHGVGIETRLLGDGSTPLDTWHGETADDVLRTHVETHRDEITAVLGAL